MQILSPYVDNEFRLGLNIRLSNEDLSEAFGRQVFWNHDQHKRMNDVFVELW